MWVFGRKTWLRGKHSVNLLLEKCFVGLSSVKIVQLWRILHLSFMFLAFTPKSSDVICLSWKTCRCYSCVLLLFRWLNSPVKFVFGNLMFFSCQVVEDGYEFFAKRQLVTLFSAPNYCGEFDNAGAMMSVDETLMCSFQVCFALFKAFYSNIFIASYQLFHSDRCRY